jgi:hypothetical protein
MGTDTILIDVYDRYGKKLIKGITPISPANQASSILKDHRDRWNYTFNRQKIHMTLKEIDMLRH